MRESILTIPVSEIFEPKCGCPICRMRDMLEERTIEYIMGAAMMEPDVRMETNRLGFCKIHFEQMRDCKNRLSLALMLQSHLQDIKKIYLTEKTSLREKTQSRKRFLKSITTALYVQKQSGECQGLQSHFLKCFQSQEISESFFLSRKCCACPIMTCLSACQGKVLKKKYQKQFIEACSELVKKYLDNLEKDVSHYCKMYDYRNTGKNADWGNSKDSIERSIKFLTSR